MNEENKISMPKTNPILWIVLAFIFFNGCLGECYTRQSLNDAKQDIAQLNRQVAQQQSEHEKLDVKITYLKHALRKAEEQNEKLDLEIKSLRIGLAEHRAKKGHQ